jgi:hypothetical protein
MVDQKGKDFQNKGIKETCFQSLWYFRLRHRCPLCNSKLWEKGHPQDFCQAYKCSDRKCGWGW